MGKPLEESPMERHEREMLDDSNRRDTEVFSEDDSVPPKYEDHESQAIYESERNIGA